ncbi:F-box protein [Melia azedarach]|uniref:F-box protein n=1 Tax=Melia azedarach TaxID=155640 RepID=A0ACC1XUY5_MELAZ|nr:F-box protein [Melia azedarach]
MARFLNFLPLPRLMKKKQNTCNNSSIESLPMELLTEILSQVASSSVTDLSNAKQSCRKLLKAGNDDYVFQHASLDKFPIAWPATDRAAYLFLTRCKRSGNAEALYRQGMLEYFSFCCTNSGLQLLKRAAEKKHAESIYVYSVIVLCSGDDQFKKQGSQLLASLTSSRIRECRENIKRVIRWMLIRNIIVQEEKEDSKPRTCNCLSKKNAGWENEDEIIGCRESCLSIGEVTFFCNLLRNYYVFKHFE